ncbi:MAG: CoF synthetase [Deltaproteobacteria bacterium]|nr:MAG: CoF synthetase [Deltaproteobacteria bacterium]
MSLLLKLKKIVESIPESISSKLVWVPFSWRLGRQYKKSQAEIDIFNRLNVNQRKDYIFRRVKNIVEFAARENDFYREIYRNRGFDVNRLRNFDDINLIPIVTKADLQHCTLNKRSNLQRGRIVTNTGGTSGEPLEFYLDSNAFAREWAHFHYIWSKLGYQQIHLKLTFRGKNLGDKPLKYNPVHNEFMINAYIEIAKVGEAIRDVAQRRNVAFLHGYPSAIYRFASYCAENDPELANLLSSTLRGILLSSEYPAPVYRDIIESTFKVPTLSWFGHSEMAILAYEDQEQFLFSPMHTYGYCEAVPDKTGEYQLVATSYYNTASPFIRYTTGDLIIPVGSDKPLKGFRITYGRMGEFIIDESGEKISLTALIFGRHHRIFGTARYLQVYQESPGLATILVTLPEGANKKIIDWDKEFDSSGVKIKFKYEVINKPFFTISGKIPLLITRMNKP